MLRGVALSALGYALGTRAARVAIGRSSGGATARPGASSGAASPSSMLRISVPGRGGNGSEGTSIWATIEARLLGLPLLTLDADVALVPAEVDVGGTSEGKQRNGSSDRRGTYDPPGARNGIGQAGHGLADAVRALEASSDDLQKAREQMP